MKIKEKVFGRLSQTVKVDQNVPTEKQPFILTAIHEGKKVKGFMIDIFLEDEKTVVEFAVFKPFEDLVYISPSDILFAEQRIIGRVNGKQHYTNRTR